MMPINFTRQRHILLAIAVLASVAFACRALTGGGAPLATSTPTPRLILSDDFSYGRWGTGKDSDSSVEYLDDALQISVYTQSLFVWSTPNAETYQNVHLETKVTNNSTDPKTAFGIICNKQGKTNSFHYLVIRPNGEYLIAKATDGQSDIYLTNNGEWATSGLIPVDSVSYHVGADCGHSRLTLYVDGQQIATVADSGYTSGRVALMVWSGPGATSTNVSFDDFLMTELPQ